MILLFARIGKEFDSVGISAAVAHFCFHSHWLSGIGGRELYFNDVADAQLDSGEDGHAALTHIASPGFDDLGGVQRVPEDQANRHVDAAAFEAAFACEACGGWGGGCRRHALIISALDGSPKITKDILTGQPALNLSIELKAKQNEALAVVPFPQRARLRAQRCEHNHVQVLDRVVLKVLLRKEKNSL